MPIAFGLDFGTSNSSLSVAQNGIIKLLAIDPSNSSKETMKSVLFFGEECKKISVGEIAINRYLEEGGRLMRSIKTLLPDRSFEETRVFEKRFTIEMLIGTILRKIKERGEELVGETISSVVLGRPVAFSKNSETDAFAEQRLLAAAQLAGFTQISFQYEPVAAALACEEMLLPNEEKLVFLGDFGGGTSDFSVMRLRGNRNLKDADRKKDVLAVGGVYVGGNLFDSRIMWEKIAPIFGRKAKFRNMSGQILEMPLSLFTLLCQWHTIPQLQSYETKRLITSLKQDALDKQPLINLEELIKEDAGYRLFGITEEVKCKLSDQEQAIIEFHLSKLRIAEPITRQEFGLFIQGDLNKISTCAHDVLSEANVTPQEIDMVLLTGGSSFVSQIRTIFAEWFGKEKIQIVDPFTSIAYGLGITAMERYGK